MHVMAANIRAPETDTMLSSTAVPSLSSDTASISSSSSSLSLSSLSLDTRWATGLAGLGILEDDGTGALVVPSPPPFPPSYPPSSSSSHDDHLHPYHDHLPPPAPTPPPHSTTARSTVSAPPTTPIPTGAPSHDTPYPCLFHILNCHSTFTSASDWKTHVLSHFRTHAPPPTARCPLCPPPPPRERERDLEADQHPTTTTTTTTTTTSTTSSTPSTPTTSTTTTTTTTTFTNTPTHSAWDLLLSHIDVEHYQKGHTLSGSRPDFELMRYLYGRRIISVDQFKVLQMMPARGSPAYHRSQESGRLSVGSGDEPFCAPYSRRREERMARGRR